MWWWVVYNVEHSSKFDSIRDYKLYSEKTVHTCVTCWHFSRFPVAGWGGAFSCSHTGRIVCELRHFFFIEVSFSLSPQLSPFPLALTIDYCWPPRRGSCSPVGLLCHTTTCSPPGTSLVPAVGRILDLFAWSARSRWSLRGDPEGAKLSPWAVQEKSFKSVLPREQRCHRLPWWKPISTSILVQGLCPLVARKGNLAQAAEFIFALLHFLRLGRRCTFKAQIKGNGNPQ